MTAVAVGGFVDHSVPGLTPGSDEWLQMMTASKVAAVMGHSAYDSLFSLWHVMAGTISRDDEQNAEEKLRGTLLEPAILEWFRRTNLDLTYHPVGMFLHPELDGFGATPDGAAVDPDGRVAFVEAKSAANPWEWGDPGTSEVPLGYFDQATFQMAVGRHYYPELDRVYMPVLLGGSLSFALYVVEWDEEYAGRLMARAALFMDNLRAGITPSIDPLDGHMETYRAIRELHPDIERRTVTLSDEVALRFITAYQEHKDAEEALNAARTRVAAEMGNAQKAVWRNESVMGRQSNKGGTPYCKVVNGLLKKDFSNTDTGDTSV